MRMGMGFELGMGQEMSQSHTMELRQEMSQSHTMELRQEMHRKNFDQIEKGVIGPPEELFQEVINYTLGHIRETSLKIGVESVISDPALQQKLFDSAEDFAAEPNIKLIRKLIINWFYDSHQETFEFEVNDIGYGKIPVRISRDNYEKALNKSSSLTKELSLLRSEEQNADHFAKKKEYRSHILELECALELAPQIEEAIASLTLALQYLLNIKVAGNSNPILSFLRDVSLIRQIRFVLSDRLSERIASRFDRIHKQSESQEFENAFLNSLAEYTLVGVGVIDPDLFTLFRGQVDEQLKSRGASDSNIQKDAARAGDRSNVLYFQRWKTLGKPVTQLSDSMIRNFITKSVRQHKEAVLAEFQFDRVFEIFKDALISQDGKRHSKKEGHSNMVDAVSDFFENEEVLSKLIVFARTIWNPELERLTK